MICYLDTSAITPMLISEPSSPVCRELWMTADDIVSSQLAYIECAAALAAAQRAGRIDSAGHQASLSGLDRLWAELDAYPVEEELLKQAAQVAAAHALRGYDAVHCVSAMQLADPDLVAVSGDKHLLQAWTDLGIASLDVNQ